MLKSFLVVFEIAIVAMSFSASIHERLREDSASIDKALEVFLAERTETAMRQAEALASYEEEIAAIGLEGDMGDIEDEMNDVNITNSTSVAPTGNYVDHNIRRLMNLGGDEGGGSKGGEDCDGDDYDDEYEEFDNDDFGDNDNLGAGTSVMRAMESIGRKKKGKKKEVYVKRSVPTPEVKKGMRTKLFGLLSQQRIEEKELEDEIAAMWEEEEPDEKQINSISDILYEKQKEHYDKIVEFVDDYQPRTSGRAWGGDPEYYKMLKEMKKRVDRNFSGV